MTGNELEEYRSDVATYLLNNMSKGSVFQYAHDKMMQLLAVRTEEELNELMPPPKPKKPKDKSKSGTGF